jgi:hypothetical protein
MLEMGSYFRRFGFLLKLWSLFEKLRIFGIKKNQLIHSHWGKTTEKTFWFQQKKELHKSKIHCEPATHLDFLQGWLPLVQVFWYPNRNKVVVKKKNKLTKENIQQMKETIIVQKLLLWSFYSFFLHFPWIFKMEIRTSNFEIQMERLLQSLDPLTNDSIGAFSSVEWKLKIHSQ